MAETLEQRVSEIERENARTSEQYKQIMQCLAVIQASLSALNDQYVRRDLCDMAHKAQDQREYEYRHAMEKHVADMEARVNVRIDDSEDRVQKAIDGVGGRLNSWAARLWILFLPTLGGLLYLLLRSAPALENITQAVNK